MTIAANLRDDEELAITSLAKEFGGTWRVGENPPDAYLSVGAREIAVEISTLTQQITDGRHVQSFATETKIEINDNRAGPGCLNSFPREISGVLPGLVCCGLPRMGCDGGRA